MKLHDKLNHLDKYPFHMPGHKRNPKFDIIGAQIDITEIDGFDNLHDSKDTLLEIENSLSSIYKSKKSFMLINGSTVGILAAIFAVCDDGDKIIIARNCHKSVYNVCMLKKLSVVYIEPAFDYENGYYTYISQNVIDTAIKKHPDAKAVVITSPTYEGNISNVTSKIPLIIDAAHGAHLPFCEFANYPCGDIVVSSLHKTLPALTQTAVLNVYNDKYIEKAKLYLDIFETSSPSYVLMNSVSICCMYLENSKKDFEEYISLLNDFHSIKLNYLKIKTCDDLSKIVVSTAKSNITANILAEQLRTQYSIEPEMISTNYIILMTSVADDKNAFHHLKNALVEIDGTLCGSNNEDVFIQPVVPYSACKIIIAEKTDLLDIDDAIGKISAEFVYAYPPDIPIVVPGEVINKETVDYLKAMYNAGVNIISDSALLPNKMLTKTDI